MSAPQVGPGVIVRMRGREWVVLERATDDALSLRPIGGVDADVQVVWPKLERGLQAASFSSPNLEQAGPSADARLLKEALALSLRRGAGPFRSFGRLAFEPRAYQLAPLLMALKLDPIRLLIADDVGIGKTIEAGLIARELLDRGEVRRLTIMCPPHLVEQWVDELSSKFGIEATAVTAATAPRLERGLPIGVSLMEAHPFTVVSLDFVKSDRRRSEFVNACPNFVIVDEAHACVGAGGSRRQQRYTLLSELLKRPERHLLLLTATPHSGDTDAFARLTGLLHPDFLTLDESTGERRAELRRRLGDQFVQRRRADIDAWKEPGLFPIPETKEVTYRLHPDAASFYEAVLDYAAEVTDRAGSDQRRRRLAFWGTLAIMRCVASSPVAALQALRSRALRLDEISDEEARLIETRAFDGTEDDLSTDDSEPIAIDDPGLANLMLQAEGLARDPKRDEKLKKLIVEVRSLVAEGFNPVIFCRFIATAQGVGAALESALSGVAVDVVTGLLASDARRDRVEQLGEAESRILVATDCLSEGVNLQSYFDAVVHYDLSWNPTRHQQREGRVNRYGQKSGRVRFLLLYGENNPVDGAVLQVILRKAEKIRKETGVPVPLPDDERAMTEALMQAVLLRRGNIKPDSQLALFDELPEAQKIEKTWTDASEREKQTQTIFAQRALKPEAVIPEWEKARSALGGNKDAVQRFLDEALARFGAPLEKDKSGWRFRLPDPFDHQGLKDRLAEAGVPERLKISFEPGADREHVHRTHPLVAATAETLFERTLDGDADPKDIAVLGRCGAWLSRSVSKRTIVALLRLRHRLIPQADQPAMLAEEASALAWEGGETMTLASRGDEALQLLDAGADSDLAEGVRRQRIAAALAQIGRFQPDLDAFAHDRAEALAEDHERVRAATMRERRTGLARIRVEPVTPVDIIGLYILIPVIG